MRTASVLVLALAAGCSHDETPPQTPVSVLHTTAAPVPEPLPQPNVPNARAPARLDDTSSTRPDHSGDSVMPQTGVDTNGGFDPYLDADEHASGLPGHRRVPIDHAPIRQVPIPPNQTP